MATVTETHCHPSPKLKLNELFVQWFNLPETQHAISLVLDEAVNASDDRAAGASFAPSHGTPDVQRLLHLSISADGRSPPASPTANGFSHLSLSSSPRTPPRSPELHTTHLDGTSRGRRGAAGESDVIAATVKAATSPSALALSSTHSALAAAAAADMADAGGEGALAVGGAPSLVSPRSRRARAGSRLAAPAALSPQKRSLSLVRHEDDATHGDESGRRLSSAGGAAAGGSGVADGGGKKSKDFVPPFYQPLGRQPPAARELESAHVRDEIARAASGAAVLPYDLALAICVGPLQLPAAAARVLLGRLVRQAAEASGGGEMADDPPAISVALFARFADELAVGFPLGARVFHALANEGSAWLDASDLRALVRTVVDFHPGLAFLAATPEFQERYVETVVLRIIYTIARCGAPTVSRSALQRSALPAALAALDVEDDINASSAFFSYEHFYVIYCKFWELDDDHDMHLSRDDLARYADYSLSSRIVERVYALATSEAAAASVHLPPPLATAPQADDAGGAGGGAPAAAEGEGNGEARMTYPHFVWFVLSEEDKGSRASLEYWFRRVDLDHDGFISGYEIDFFYTEQLHRMRCMGQEPVEVPDIVCQLFDLVKPPEPRKGIALRDLLACALGGKLFDILFNLNKFLAWESKDPHSIREERAQPQMTEWERFCKREYLRLALEDEPAEADQMAVWADVGSAGGAGGVLSANGSQESPF